MLHLAEFAYSVHSWAAQGSWLGVVTAKIVPWPADDCLSRVLAACFRLVALWEVLDAGLVD